ncbi:MAG: DNA-binding response regulator [Gammaproteobacteria bacterium]|nr:MAG: DNA-binding response regulator [Gammaproteobacteria bacterium]
MTRLLLVEDDAELCAMLQEYLAPEGFAVTAIHDGRAGAQAALEGDFDVMVLDVMLPSLSGFEVLRKVRAQRGLPVLMLTARGEDTDRIVGLELGADDYLPKPFNPRELVARLRAILRRVNQAGSEGAILRAGPLELHPASRRALLGGEPLDLTSTEFELLRVLMQRAGRPVSKEELSRQALGRPLGRFDRSIDMHVSNLRRKLGDPALIETVRGKGYQLVCD